MVHRPDTCIRDYTLKHNTNQVFSSLKTFRTLETGLLCPPLSLCAILCPGLLCGSPNDRDATSEIRPQFYIWKSHIHGILRNSQRAHGTSQGDAKRRSPCVYHHLHRIHALDALFYLQRRWCVWLSSGVGFQRDATCGSVMVPHLLLAWWLIGPFVCLGGHGTNSTTRHCRMCQIASGDYRTLSRPMDGTRKQLVSFTFFRFLDIILFSIQFYFACFSC